MTYDRIVPKPSVASHARTPGPDTGQRHDILLSPRCYWEFGQQSKSLQCLFRFYGSAPIVIRPKRYLSLQKFKMPEFKNTAFLNGL